MAQNARKNKKRKKRITNRIISRMTIKVLEFNKEEASASEIKAHTRRVNHLRNLTRR